MSERRDQQSSGDEPRPRNPFAERLNGEDDERPALISTKRSAALWGVVAGLVFLILIVAACVLGNIAFG